jgi:type IV pilus assembly protein PilB
VLHNGIKGLVDILVGMGRITREQLDYALELQKKRGDKLDRILVDEGIMSQTDMMEILRANQLGIPYVSG